MSRAIVKATMGHRFKDSPRERCTAATTSRTGIPGASAKKPTKPKEPGTFRNMDVQKVTKRSPVSTAVTLKPIRVGVRSARSRTSIGTARRMAPPQASVATAADATKKKTC